MVSRKLETEGVNLEFFFKYLVVAEETSAKNLLVIHDKKLAEQYMKNWQEHERPSEVYVGRGRWTYRFFFS